MPVGSEPVSLAVADFNGDGKADLAIANYKGGNVTVLLGDNNGGFKAAVGSPYAAGTLPHALAVGDFNLDGKPDLAFADEGGNNVTVLLNANAGPAAVSAASGLPAVAPGSIMSIYGSNLATAATSATTPVLPFSLSGTSVIISYSDKSQASLPLFYASPTQINALIPVGAIIGAATLTVFTPAGVQSISLTITAYAPGLFAANENGKGVALAQLVNNLANGFQVVTNVFQCPAGSGTCIPVPIDVSPGKPFQPVLVLYGTGLHNASSGDVQVTIANAQILYVGPAGYTGEDQINVMLPATLMGSGLVSVSVSVAGAVSNKVTVYIQ
jgi:uncharacterized protein (TIGR03437 family)